MYITLLILLPILAFAMFYASYSIRLGVYIKCLCRNKKAGKVISITFDDGVDPLITPKVLDVLKKHGVTATFFIIGSKAYQFPNLVTRIISEGHEIGSHSYSHSWNFPLMSTNTMLKDLHKAHEALNEISNKDIKYFRPPFGVTNPTIAKAVRQMGYTTIGWSIRSLDTKEKSREWVLKRVLKRVHPGGIILLHDSKPKADKLLDAILNNLITKGYKVVSINNLFNNK